MSHTNEPTFTSTGQALYVAFAMEVSSMVQKGGTQIVIEDMMEHRYGTGNIERGERQLIMGNMTPLELRGQCAQIRRVVAERLQRQERDVIWARYGRIDEHKGVLTRVEGVTGLAKHFYPECSCANMNAVAHLLMSLFAEGKHLRRSLRTIEREHGSTKSVLQRDQAKLRVQCDSLELRAITRVDDLFVRTGLVQDAAVAYA